MVGEGTEGSSQRSGWPWPAVKRDEMGCAAAANWLPRFSAWFRIFTPTLRLMMIAFHSFSFFLPYHILICLLIDDCFIALEPVWRSPTRSSASKFGDHFAGSAIFAEIRFVVAMIAQPEYLAVLPFCGWSHGHRIRNRLLFLPSLSIFQLLVVLASTAQTT